MGVPHSQARPDGRHGLLPRRQLSMVVIKIKHEMYKYLRSLHPLVPPITEQLEIVN